MLSPVPEILEDLRQGRMIILVDDEDRENEGDLVCAAERISPEIIHFMTRHTPGYLCLALTGEDCDRLELHPQTAINTSLRHTAMTVSIDGHPKHGVGTGISASDRARTVRVAVDPASGPGDLVRPGHMVPLRARDGGVLVRTGHTEASVDIARLAGLNPAGVICEIMNEDGTMARRDDLIRFAQLHGLKIGTIRDLIAYRRRYDRIVERTLETDFASRFGGDFRLYVYTNRVAHAEHVALVKGDLHGDEPVLVRMHAMNVLDDVLGDAKSGRGEELHAAMNEIGRAGRGVIVLIREPLPTSLSDSVQRRMNAGAPAKSGGPTELRDYGVGAQILLDLGVRRMILLTNRKKIIIGLDGYGLAIDGQRPIPLDGV